MELTEKTMQGCLRTAIYVGDPNAAEEREMLLRYVETQPDLELVGCYRNGDTREKVQDDSYRQAKTLNRDNKQAKAPDDKSESENDDRNESGNENENRNENTTGYSAFSCLMEDVRKGKIQCIVVANFSGFARGYLETVYYIQNYFKYMNVRFISVNNDFDSAREEDMERITKNAGKKLTDIRSRQNSKRRCENAKERASRPGAMPTGTAPYGYLVAPDPEQKYYIPDPDTAPYVRMMFKWALLGLSSRQIADRMILIGAPTPGQLRSGSPVDPSRWEAHSVLKILQNPSYYGSICLGRMQQALYKSQPRRKTSEEEWIVRENTHEPLVTKEEYEEVQRRIAENRRN